MIVEPPYQILGREVVPGNGNYDPQPKVVRNFVQLQVDFTEQAQAACDQLPVYNAAKAGRSVEAIIPPGNYSSIIVTDTLTMLPGLYCLSGDLMVNPGAILDGDGITIFMSSGDFMVNPYAEVRLAAPAEGVLADQMWRDLLLYVANDRAATVTLAGNQFSKYHGLVYAPASDISVSTHAEYHLQVIGWNVELGGTEDIDMSVDFWPGMP